MSKKIGRRSFLTKSTTLPLLSFFPESIKADQHPDPVLTVDLSVGSVLNGMTACVGTPIPSEVRVVAWRTDSPDNTIVTEWKATNNALAARFNIPTACKDGKEWQWRGEARESASGTTVHGPIHILPAYPLPGLPSKFTFAFGSCMHAESQSLISMAERDPLFFAILGDMGYQDNADNHPDKQNYDGYVSLFRNILVRKDMTAITRKASFYGVQDDHDYGLNDCWAETVKDYAAQAYADLVPNSEYPDKTYFSWSIGEVDFFLTDHRRYRDNPERTDNPYTLGYLSYLGEEQQEWLHDELKKSTARVKILFFPVSVAWLWRYNARDELLKFINENVSGRVIICTGDRHAGGFAKFGDVWEFLACPLGSHVFHNITLVEGSVWKENFSDAVKKFGIVEVDTLQAQTVTLRLLKFDGTEIRSEVVPIY